MKITEHLAKAKKPLFSIELLPPLKGQSIQSFFDSIDPLIEFKPSFIDVTYHREEYIYKKRENGLLEKQKVRRRPSTVGICAAIMNRYHVDTVPHIICGGFSRKETEDALIDLSFLGVENLLVLRGDALKSEKAFAPHPEGNQFATDLICQVSNMNKGVFLEEVVQEQACTDFCIGVAGYPEKHFESPNMERDLFYLKQKVEMGAQYIVTQMFFDNQKYFSFVEKCREIGITVPIIPGLKPLITKKQMTVLPSIFKIDIPNELALEVEKCKNNDEVKQVGIEWGIQQCKELIEHDAPCLHFYTMNRSTSVQEIASALF
ncbi:methylenetetrahydrofolate reductase [NAD(P)H] [Limibacter armeniacum]|uniref:methylenetetrahydrofolate reductase [NAD(P)H] n=1 Tax=Limibacter armeniacum TaxID=466084 RepID=UPI002FE5C172